MIGGLILLFIVFVLAPSYMAAWIVFGILKKKNAKSPLNSCLGAEILIGAHGYHFAKASIAVSFPNT